MSEEFLQDNTKKQQTDKIFQVIEKNKDNKEISKIAFDTLSNKCLENPAIIFPILSNFISLIGKGTISLFEYGESILFNFFEDLSPKEIIKILLDSDIKKNILSLLREGTPDCPLVFNIKNSSLEKLEHIHYMTMDIFDSNFDINKYASLFRAESNLVSKNQPTEFNRREIDLLFHNDPKLKSEMIEGFVNKKTLTNSFNSNFDDLITTKEDNKIQVDEIYKKSSSDLNMKFGNNNNNDTNNVIEKLTEPRKKVRKLNNKDKEISVNISLYPFFNYIIEILKYNHSKYYSQRLCSITLLSLIKKYFDKLIYSSYDFEINFLSDYSDITSINILENPINKVKIKEVMQINLMTQLLFNSLLDRVIDTSTSENICVLKDLNLKLLSIIINDFKNEKLKKTYYQKTILLLQKLSKNNEDWQPLFTILTLYKYISFNTDGLIFAEKGLFNILLEIIEKTEIEEIRNLVIKILDKFLQTDMMMKIDKKIVKEVFFKFVDLLQNFDDIDIGVKDFMCCLYNFINFFRKCPQIKNDCFIKLDSIFKNDCFIFNSFNKMIDVRIKFFEVINHLILDGYEFDKKILGKLILIAFQGICLEEDKKIIKAQKIFLQNVLFYFGGVNENDKNAMYDIFSKNSNILFTLFLKRNIKNTNDLYFPMMPTGESSSLIIELYKAFFLSDSQQTEIKIKYQKKISNLCPIISLIIRLNTQFIEILQKNLNQIFPLTLNDDVKNMILNHEFLLYIKIISYYLANIRNDMNKTLIFHDDVLVYFSEMNNLNEMTIEIENCQKTHNLLNAINSLINFSKEQFKEIPKEFHSVIDLIKKKNLIHIRLLNNSMKEIYIKSKKNNNEQVVQKYCELAKKIKDNILQIEKDQETNPLRLKVRGYISACLFLHSYYKQIKTNKISAIANSFLNCMKMNDKESGVFMNYFLSLISNIENEATYQKILFTFFDNNIKMCQDIVNSVTEKNNKALFENKIIENLKNFKCRPMKYFFKNFLSNNPKDTLKILINKYIQYLKSKNEKEVYEKIMIFLFLFPQKNSTEALKQELLVEILKNIIPEIKNNPEYIFYISNIIFNAVEYFIDFDLKSILDFLFKQVNTNNISIFKLINSILEDEKISIASIDDIFVVLGHINSQIEEIRKISTSIFSKQMKIISILKFSDNYNEITKSNSNVKSLQFISNIFNQNINDMKELKIKLKIKLRNYQLIGINWLLFLGNYGLGLALCDDMGLGKSIQTLVAVAESSIEYRLKTKINPINLIVCPNTLIMNWIFESKKFFNADTLILESNLEKLKNIKKYNNSTEVVFFICSYEKIRDNLNEIFDKKNFYYLVVDEAHIIKNPKTKIYQSIKKISSEKRIILTGTPIQNNVMELWALFDFLMPGFLGSENDFEIKYHKKMAQNIKKLNLQEDVQENIFQTSLQEIRKRIKPFILRRLKNDVLKELPEKIISDFNCVMSDVQKKLYEKYNVMYNNNKLNTEKSALAVIDKLRKICDHPYLLDSIENIKLKTNQEKEELVNQSGKLKSLEELLISLGFDSAMNTKTNINSSSYENKLLIFTQMTKMCKILEEFLKYKFPGINFMTLTGDTKQNDRGRLVQKFNDDPSVNVLILTTNTGGLGLNLTSANIVVMYDHNWNPSKDMQAIDRAHRLGQKKIVQVFRLITIDSIEEQLINLQAFKKYISNNVVDTSKIHEDKVNINSVMQSFEEFSNDRMNMNKNNKIKKEKMSKIEEITARNEEDEKREELEIAYLQKLIEN